MNAIICSAIVLFATIAFSEDSEGFGQRYLNEKTVNITVKVTDFDGKPVEMALVANGREGYHRVNKFTDRDGIARFEKVEQGYFNPVILKNNYYNHRGAFNIRALDPGIEREYLVRLKPVLSPVSIKVEPVDVIYPLSWEGTGAFDLERLDFVAPHGKGVISDLVIKTTWQRVESEEKYRSGLAVTTLLTLVDANDALFAFDAPILGEISEPGSSLMPPNYFPGDGYVHSASYQGFYSDNGRFEPAQNSGTHLAFRVRTRLDKSGKLESAHVGWIQAPISTGIIIAIGPERKRYTGSRVLFLPEWGCLGFTRHWNPDAKSLSLEPKGLRWENSLPYYIKTYNLEKLPGIETLQRLPRDHQDFRPTPEEEAEEIRRNLAERIRQKKLAKEREAGLK